MTLQRSVLVTWVAALCSVGCTGFGDFDVAIDLRETRVEGSVLGGLLGGVFDVPIPLEVDLQAETAARDTGPAQSVFLAELTLTITPTAEPSGDSDDFDFVDRAEIFVESAMDGSTLPRQRIAILDPVPDGQRTISFDTDTSVDLLPYINEGARLTSEAEGRQPQDDVTFVGLAVLTVEVL